MAEFRRLYYTPMDRAYHQAITEAPADAPLEKPIFPIDQLGETVPETDQSGKNIIQTTQAAIRGGAGTLQLVMTTSHEAAIGGRIKSLGKEVRETLREIALANKVKIEGVELPTSLKNLTGFDYGQQVFSDDARRRGLDEVKDAIKFIADVAGGGGVDIVSWEFPRAINDAKWNDQKKLFEREAKTESVAWLVDDRTGQTQRISKTQGIHIPFHKEGQGYKKFTIDELENRKLPLTEFKWKDFEEWAKYNSQQKNGLPTTPEKLFVDVQLNAQIASLDGSRAQQEKNARLTKQEIEAMNERLGDDRIPEEVKKRIRETELPNAELQYKEYLNSARAQEQQAIELKDRKQHYKPVDEYGKALSTNSYAEAGIAAMHEYQAGIQKGTVSKEKGLHVGPEIGWPEYYGSHPAEFKELILQSREKMVDLLTKPKVTKPDGTLDKNPYYDPRVSEEKAKELASEHIKGVFDTGHMGMWLAHFKPLDKDPETGTRETEDRRIVRFNKWYMDQIKELAKDPGLIGGIQLVDSQSAAHAHLPPGEGIFPVIETAKAFKEGGFSGFLVSEGHEEEKFGVGRIRTKTWQKAGASIGTGYFASPVQQRWPGVASGYFGKTYSPLFLFGSYAPSNEFKLWSEVPLE